MATPERVTFTHAGKRFVATIEGEEVAFSEVDVIAATALLIKHTEVLPAHEGKGLGGALVRHVLEEARGQRKSVIPICPFAAGYIRRHPEYLDVVREDYRERLR